jgi:uncharacterized protein (TIGR03437 family)
MGQLGGVRSTGSTIIRLASWVLCSLAVTLPGWAVTLVHRPYLQNVREDRATVLWSARENTSATLQYSIDQAFALSITAHVRTFSPSQTALSFTLYQYQADLAGLTPGAEYSYRIIMDGQNVTPEPDHRFRTASRSEPFSFLVFGDSGSGSPSQRAMSVLMASEHPNLVLHVGDVAYEEGTFDQFHANYFEYYFSLMRRVPFFPVAGNHEYYTQRAAPYLALHSLPSETVPAPDLGRYYSFDWGGVHFVALDSNLLDNPPAAARMLNWLETDLAATTARWRVAYFHHLPYPLDHHLDDPYSANAHREFVPRLERYGVQLVLTGHEHIYERTKFLRRDQPVSSGSATLYITTGGGGGIGHSVKSRDFVERSATIYHYLRVEVETSRMTIRAIDQNGREFDRATLTVPAITSEASVVNGASFTAGLAPGGIVTIFGTGLAGETTQSSTVPLPSAISGTSVTVNGAPLPLFFASPTQINAQLRLDQQGPAILRVTTPGGFSEVPVQIAEAAPGIFSPVQHANGTNVTASAPAQPGETLVVYATGLGVVDNTGLEAGQISPATPLARSTTGVMVQIGGTTVVPDFAGLTPGFVGLYQVNVKLPADLAPTSYQLRLSAKGNTSNSLSVPVLRP